MADNINQYPSDTVGWATAAQQTNPNTRAQNLGMEGPNRSRFNQFTVSIGNGETQALLPDNRWRNYLRIENQSASDIRLGFSVRPSTITGSIITAGGFIEFDHPRNVPFNSIYLLGTAASQTVNIIEGVIDRTLSE